MKRKIFFAVLVLVISMGIASAVSVDVGSYKFDIPDGYKQDHMYDIDNQKTFTNFMDTHSNGKTFFKSGDEITVTVNAPDNGDQPDDLAAFFGGDKTEIANKTGYLSFDGHIYTFSYVNDGDWILVKATNKDMIKDILPK